MAKNESNFQSIPKKKLQKFRIFKGEFLNNFPMFFPALKKIVFTRVCPFFVSYVSVLMCL